MINLGINEFIRNMKKNIFVIIQMVIVYMITFFMVSALVEQLSLFWGVSDFFDSTGCVIYNVQLQSASDYPTEENIKRNLKKVENVVATYGMNYTDSTLQFVAYDNEKVSYKIPLKEGKWFYDAPKKEGYTNIVVSDNAFPKVSVGDDLELEGHKFHVTGIFSSDEMVYGLQMFTQKKGGSVHSYLSYYSTPNSLYNEIKGEVSVAVCSSEDLKKISSDKMYDLPWISIDFEDDITDEEISDNMTALSDNYGLIDGFVLDYKDIYSNSMKILEIKLLPIIVIFVLMLLLIFTSLLSSSAINVNYEKRNYGIYFITGNSWENTIVLSLINWSCVCITALILSISASLIITATGKFDFLTLNFSGYHILAIICVTLLMLFMALILPYRMLKKLQPVTILKNNEK